MTGTASLAARLRRLERERAKAQPMMPGSGRSDPVRPDGYAGDPVGYLRDVLGASFVWDKQVEIAEALRRPPYKVLVKSGHNIGKTWIAAGLINWFHDNFRPGVVISTAPTYTDVKDLLWKEVRVQRLRAGLGGFIGPAAPEMRTGPDHYAKGYTAQKGESFQGRHDLRMLFVFDEAVGVDPIYWETAKTMFKAEAGHMWLAIGNPTSTTSAAYQQCEALTLDGDPAWTVITLSALDHPNIAAHFEGRPLPVPPAVSVQQIESEWLPEWCDEVAEADACETDVQWPPEPYRKPGEPRRFYRPGDIFQARALGDWPRGGSGVWGKELWEKCLRGPEPAIDPLTLPEIGCDMATGKGEDFHAIHCRWGGISLHHETANVMDPEKVFRRLKDAAEAMARLVNGKRHVHAEPVSPKRIPIKVDDDGTGGAVAAFLKADGYTCAAVGAGTKAAADTLYPRKRDELWFQVAKRAKAGGVYVGRLAPKFRRLLKQQLLAPTWEQDGAGRREVERKDKTKERIGRSPDDADAFNLAYLEGPLWKAPEGVDRDPAPPRESLAARRGMFGRTR